MPHILGGWLDFLKFFDRPYNSRPDMEAINIALFQ